MTQILHVILNIGPAIQYSTFSLTWGNDNPFNGGTPQVLGGKPQVLFCTLFRAQMGYRVEWVEPLTFCKVDV
jgi:hypothetical protein